MLLTLLQTAFLFSLFMKKSLIFLSILSLLYSCKNSHFHIEGTVKNAGGQMIYLVHDELGKSHVMDSVKLDAEGWFSFAEQRPQYPDFYKLVLADKQYITLAVDSCEDIQIQTQQKKFSSNYSISGSPVSAQIKQLRVSLIKIEELLEQLRNEKSEARRAIQADKLLVQIETHKEMARKLILENPASSAAYLAIYQQVDGRFVFSPYDKVDAPYFKAVATAYDANMPEYIRSKNLYSLVMDAIKKERNHLSPVALQELVRRSGKGVIDISLPDRNNMVHNLSDLKGKVVILDFNAFSTPVGVRHALGIYKIYSKYQHMGLSVYQVSVDEDPTNWLEASQKLPWINVLDPQGPASKYLRAYWVSQIPTTFLINRNGDIVKRNPGYEDIEQTIQQL